MCKRFLHYALTIWITLYASYYIINIYCIFYCIMHSYYFYERLLYYEHIISFYTAVGKHIHTGEKALYQVLLKRLTESFKQCILPLSDRSPSRSSSSPPAEAGLVGIVVWITGTTSLPPSKSNKSLACRTSKHNKHVK